MENTNEINEIQKVLSAIVNKNQAFDEFDHMDTMRILQDKEIIEWKIINEDTTEMAWIVTEKGMELIK